jgi:hypothetical protein
MDEQERCQAADITVPWSVPGVRVTESLTAYVNLAVRVDVTENKLAPR